MSQSKSLEVWTLEALTINEKIKALKGTNTKMRPETLRLLCHSHRVLNKEHIKVKVRSQNLNRS